MIPIKNRSSIGILVLAFTVSISLLNRCGLSTRSENLKLKISAVNAPTDIVILGANYLAKDIQAKSEGKIIPKVYHSGVLSGGNGSAEIEMCQQGSIEMHITTTAYLANLVPRTSIISLPFLFRDVDQVVRIIKSKSAVLDSINKELGTINLNIIAWWPRGFRQLTNSKRPVKTIHDIQGLKFRVMNNSLYVDNMNAMKANPVPMAWGEVYNALQLNTIDGQENAEDVIYNSRLYEAQKFMTIWDYSTDIEVVMVNLKWWNGLTDHQREIIQQVADASVDYEADLLKETTRDLRQKIEEKGMQIDYLTDADKQPFRELVKPVWDKYEKIFTKPFMDAFLNEVNNIKPI
jgi:tripartite ATP-independent transporter DctP family solute receptor